MKVLTYPDPARHCKAYALPYLKQRGAKRTLS
jgi:hypothetical protein